MAFWLRSTKTSFRYACQPNTIFRYLRNARRNGEPKLLKGSIKTIDEPDFQYEIGQNYQDFVKNIKSSTRVDDIAIEQALNEDDDFVSAINAAAKPGDGVFGEDKSYKSFVKKKIIGKKYFKLEIESTLLTHAAKEQIRYLHRMDPEQWNPETLSQSFPITVNGAKKLLKSTFVIQSPERIKQHDKEVAERWEHLMSGTPSSLITPYTQRMWNEGKVMKEHYNGNPNLPNVPPVTNQTVIYPEEKEVGEYSAIIQQYINYKKNRELPKNIPDNSDETQVGDVSEKSWRHKTDRKKILDVLNRNKYHVDDETDEANYTSDSPASKARRNRLDEAEVLHSQFKENLKSEVTSKKFNSDPRYAEWMKRQSTLTEMQTPHKPVNPKELFTKIPKFKKEMVEFNREISEKGDVVYFYDDKLGYQHPKGKLVQSKIHLPDKSRKKGTVYKKGQAVYDDDGEFLYKVPK